MILIMANKEHKSIFIDTNVLAALNLLFLAYDSLKIQPSDYFHDLSDLENALNVKLPDCYESRAIQVGFKTWCLLQTALESYNVDLYYSYLADIEFRDILINNKFHEYLSKEGFCYRVFKKRPLKNQVFFSYADEIEPVCQKMYDRLGDWGVSLIWCEDNEGSSIAAEIVPMLKILSKYVFLDAMDAYFYCLSIRNLCNVFLTNDTEFYGVMKNLLDSSDNDWKNLRDNIVKDFCALLPVFDDFVKANNSLLPTPVNPRDKKVAI